MLRYQGDGQRKGSLASGAKLALKRRVIYGKIRRFSHLKCTARIYVSWMPDLRAVVKTRGDAL